MRFKNVVIRERDAVDILDSRIMLAFSNANKGEAEIPIYYQFCQEREVQLVENPDYYVGKATNIHFNEDQQLVCDCLINMAAPIAQNFMNVIDNFLVSIVRDPEGNAIPILRQFLIYDKTFKEQVMRKRREKEENSKRVVQTIPSPMETSAPLHVMDLTPEQASVLQEAMAPLNVDPQILGKIDSEEQKGETNDGQIYEPDGGLSDGDVSE